MLTWLFLFFSYTIASSKEQPLERTRMQKQRAMLEEWVTSMVPEIDYNGTYQWRRTFRSKSASTWFEMYNDRFSKVALSNGATVHFASIGACDGITDPVIKNQYLKNPHWQGVFVEPIDNNVVDLTAFIHLHNATNRSLILQAAATSHCTTPTVEMERPLYEEKNKSIPHWLRSVYRSTYPSPCPSVCPSPCPSTCLPVCVSVRLSVCLFVCLSAHLPACL